MNRPRFRGAAILGLVFTLALAGGCGAEPDPVSERPLETGIAIRSFTFDPHTVRVQKGATVVWTNEDDIAHTVTSGEPAEGGVPGVAAETSPGPDGLFDEALDGSGATASFTFEKAGTFQYFCAIHDGMTGFVEVS